MSAPFEEQALEVLRGAARDVRAHGLPPDASFPHDLAAVVRAAYEAGGHRTAQVIASAYELAQGEDDDEILARTIDEEMPPGSAPLS